MFLASVVASGSPVAIPEAAVTALLGYAVVFFGQFLLMLVVMAMGKIMQGSAAKKAAPAPAAPAAPAAAPVAAEPVGEPAPGSAGKLKIYNVEPKTAAMAMAIVADKLQKPINELRFISIKEVE